MIAQIKKDVNILNKFILQNFKNFDILLKIKKRQSEKTARLCKKKEE